MMLRRYTPIGEMPKPQLCQLAQFSWQGFCDVKCEECSGDAPADLFDVANDWILP